MAHSSADFGSHMLGLLKNSGPTGPTGNSPDKPLIHNEKAGTSQTPDPLPVDFNWSHHVAVSGTNIVTEKQVVSEPVTSVTSVTSLFEQARTAPAAVDCPAECYAILQVLKALDPPEWLSAERWKILISDAENFLPRWGSAAYSLGWSALDLFGVHPLAPAARFDVMGLLPVLNGAAVLTLTADAATLRQRSGSTSTYRRPTQTGAVLISEMSA